MIKDNFSAQAKTYATFRPTYPKEVYEYIFSVVKSKKMAWDCGTGNGQMAQELAKELEEVFASDISQKQLDNAFQAKNIHYSLQKAEKTDFEAATFDLITVAQAIHWFQFDDFYEEVSRVAKPNAILFVIGYSTPRFEGKVDEIVQDFYQNVVGKYWDAERKHIDNHYASIPFPFEEIACPNFSMNYEWSIEILEGYLNSWSSVQHYIKANGRNPVEAVIEQLKPIFKSKETTTFQLFTKVGLVP